MATKMLGRAQYTAYRLAGVTSLTAVGQTPNLNDKVDFEQLPFLIQPPLFAFYFISAEIGLPALKTFKHEEIIAFPSDARIVRIQDADGMHDVPIAEVTIPPFQISAKENDGSKSYCVFAWIGINNKVIAKCDAVLPAVYSRVFGPDTFAACEKYVKDNGGI